MNPALMAVVVESLILYTNQDDFSVPQVKMRYVTVVLTMKQVCFRLWTLLCVTASSEMCRAQLWDLDDSCCVGAIDSVQGQGWIRGIWQWSNLWMQAKESVCGLNLNNSETTFPRSRPQVQCELSMTATSTEVTSVGASAWNVTQCLVWWCLDCVVEMSAEEDPVYISRCTGGGGRHRGPLPGWFLRWPEEGRNQVRLFLRPNQCITTKKDMC